jgi:D-alanine transaminase
MSKISYINGRYVNHAEAAVHIEDRGYQFADGIYEYIAFYNRTMLDADLHLKRLERSLRELEIVFQTSLAALKIIIRELIERNGRDDGGLYIQITRGVYKRDHPFPANVRPSLVMTICGAKTPKTSEIKDGVNVISLPDNRWERRDIKSVSLLANILAKQKASEEQVREAWLMEADGTVNEGSVSNCFIVTKTGELVTHHADKHILGGITREVVLKLAKKAGIPVAERAFNIVEARAAAEAFITSTSANVLPVVKIDDKTVGNGKVGEVTKKLQDLYIAHIYKQTGKKLEGK